MKISFSTTCMGRAHHLKETLPQNIIDNPKRDDLDIEFAVLNYNSHQDDLHEWMMTDPQMQEHIQSGLVRYARTTEPQEFHMSHAKNMAHRLATGDVLCNLDADNFAGSGFAKYIDQVFSKRINTVLRSDPRVGHNYAPEDRGFGGKIIVPKNAFYKINGYDESYSGWGEEDCDFIRRAKSAGMEMVHFNDKKFFKIINHSNEERAENMENSAAVLKNIIEMKARTNDTTADKILSLFEKCVAMGKPIQSNNESGRASFGLGNVTLASGEKIEFKPLQNNSASPFNICALGIDEHLKGRLAPRIAQYEQREYDQLIQS